MKKQILIYLLMLNFLASLAQKNLITRDEYINTFKDLAISEMRRSGVPASIKLAQGMLETGNGNSKLAVKGNNHFGIKCHNSWTGRRIYHDDDEKGECFRRYNSADQSYRDHSDFLRGSSRYAFLFELDPRDYKAWAQGLQMAGYATNPYYATSLIRVIEENELFLFDKPGSDRKTGVSAKDKESSVRMIYSRNRVKFVIAEEGDSFEDLRKEMRLLPNALYKYNDLNSDDRIYPGQVLFVQPKRNRAEAGIRNHIVKEGETMHSISQSYAMRLNKLYEKNLMKYGSEPEIGQELSLRRQLKGDKPSDVKQKKTPRIRRSRENIEETDKIEFEFIE